MKRLKSNNWRYKMHNINQSNWHRPSWLLLYCFSIYFFFRQLLSLLHLRNPSFPSPRGGVGAARTHNCVEIV